MPAPYSDDLRRKALVAVKRGERKTNVSKMFNISRNTLDLWLKREQETGDVRAITNYQQGCRHKITDWERFGAFIEQHGGKTQAQLAKLWGDGVTQQNISAALQKLEISRKKSPTDIENAMNTSGLSSKSDCRPNPQVGLSTSMKRVSTIALEYPYGYSKVRQRFYALKSGKRTERVSWIAALKQGKVIAPMTFSGSCNRDLFEVWLQECLLPQLQPGNTIVLDNASFHRSQAIDEIVAQAGCEWYLPPYSADYNQSEHWWFVLKNWLRQRWDEFEDFRDCVDAALKYCPNLLR